MLADLKLDSVNSHLPLRERIRVAMMEQARNTLRESAVTSVEPHDMLRLNMAVDNLELLLNCRTRHMENLTRMPTPQSIHFDTLVHLESQIEAAEETLFSLEVELFGADGMEPNSKEIAATMHAYLRSLVNPSVAQHSSVQRLLRDPLVESGLSMS